MVYPLLVKIICITLLLSQNERLQKIGALVSCFSVMNGELKNEKATLVTAEEK